MDDIIVYIIYRCIEANNYLIFKKKLIHQFHQPNKLHNTTLLKETVIHVDNYDNIIPVYELTKRIYIR
jgi:hypothetical protein